LGGLRHLSIVAVGVPIWGALVQHKDRDYRVGCG
jgi:hypothetical protein